MDTTLVDEIQSHMLGVIVGLMSNYNLTPDQVQDRYEYVLSLNVYPNTTYVEYKNRQTQTQTEPEVSYENENSPNNRLVWADLSSEEEDAAILEFAADIESEESDSDQIDESKIQVKTRREFCTAMSNGIKICPKYSSCKKLHCKNFHIKSKYICSHNTRGNYCDNGDCDLIVIRPCRKGKRCHDPECSFRHR